MNILIYSSNSCYSGSPVGGAEVSLRLIAEKFAEMGENIFYATISDSKLPGKKVETIKKVRVYSLAPLRWPFVKGKLAPRARQKFIKHQVVNFIHEVIRKEKIDIVHTYDAANNTYDILKIREKFKLNFKVIMRVAGLFWSHQVKNGMVSKERIEWVFNSVDAVNFLSVSSQKLSYKKAKKLNLRIKPKKEIIMDIGVDTKLFNRSIKKRNSGRFLIVCISRFARIAKRQDLLISAVGKVRNPEIRVEFIGSGPMLEHYKKVVKESNLEASVFFHGFLSRVDINVILENADFFALPTEYEGVPKALLEAMAKGLPCLVSNVLPLNEYVHDNINGVLCLNTIEGWVEAIEKIYKQRDKTASLSKSARKYVLDHFDASNNILKYKKEFEELLLCTN
jgi:glycosyltransferase involved in cell wall biosynthesis